MKKLNTSKKQHTSYPDYRPAPPLQGLLPADPQALRFLQWFHHGWRYLYAPVPVPGERPDWKTETAYPLEPRILWQQYRHPGCLLGLGFGTYGRYALIDLDRLSSLFPLNGQVAYKGVLDALEEIGLCRPVPVQSSFSGGLHVYYFFQEEIHSFRLACAMRHALERAGYVIQDGELEIFPNCKAVGSYFKGHRLPLQQGSFLLDADLEPVSASLDAFLDAAARSADGQDYERLHQALKEARSYKRPPSSSVTLGDHHHGWRRDSETIIAEGWTAHGQTNRLLGWMAEYGHVWLGLKGQALIRYVVDTAINSPGYQRWCRHQHEIEKRATHWARCCERFYSRYPSRPNRFCSYREQFNDFQMEPEVNNVVPFVHPNVRRHEQTLGRVMSIVDDLKASGEFPVSICQRLAAITTRARERDGKGISPNTLHKPDYLPLWHPSYVAKSYPVLPDPWEQPEEPVNGEPEQVYRLSPMKVVNPLPMLPPARESISDSLNSLEVVEPESSASDCFCPKDSQVFSENSSDSTTTSPSSSTSPASDSGSIISFSYPPKIPGAAISGYKPPLSVGVKPDDHCTCRVSSGMDDDDDAACEERRRVLHAAPNQPLVFDGLTASSLVLIAGKSRMQVRLIRRHDLVVVCPTEVHSNSRLVYVKPIHGADDWRGGIAVAHDALRVFSGNRSP